MTDSTEDARNAPRPDRRRLPWWAALALCALILGTLITLAVCTTTPLILVAEAIAVVLCSAAAFLKDLR
jgi:hypothetical protein